MDRFSKTHPVFLLAFFSVSIIIPLSFFHPVITLLSLAGALLYTAVLSRKGMVKSLALCAGVIAVTGLFNMLFAHYGVDVLFQIGDTEFTIEALVYGFHQGVMLSASLLWFRRMGDCLDSEKIIYLFRFAPKSALIFSMVLGFLPRYVKKARDIREAKAALLGGEMPTGLKARFYSAIENFSALVTYSLESSIMTSDSMQARGYQPKAIRGRRFCVTPFDAALLTALILLVGYVIMEKVIGNLSFVFEPQIYFVRTSMPALIAFMLLELLPTICDVTENIKWKQSLRKA